jgi:hypothetical protein
MSSRRLDRNLKTFFLSILVTFSTASYGTIELLGEFSFELRSFQNEGLSGQEEKHSSYTFSPELYFESENGKNFFSIKPKFRKDARDQERNLEDLQEFQWTHVGRNFETKIGIRKDFWGVTETFHRVDIINQTDSVESFDGEDKLGQPMVNLSLERDWGVLDVYALIGSRERTYAGKNGRLRMPLIVDTNNPIYESSKKDNKIDFAIRWNHYFDNLELAISHFSGNTREPLLIALQDKNSMRLLPKYDLIDQTGLEASYLIEGWALKLEAITRSGQGDRFTALTTGFEYTQTGILETSLDLGWIIELNHDDREDKSPFAIGTRFSFNDIDDGQILLGVLWNESTGETNLFVEGSRRIGARTKLSVESIFFNGGKKIERSNINYNEFHPIDFLQEEDFLRIELTIFL